MHRIVLKFCCSYEARAAVCMLHLEGWACILLIHECLRYNKHVYVSAATTSNSMTPVKGEQAVGMLISESVAQSWLDRMRQWLLCTGSFEDVN